MADLHRLFLAQGKVVSDPAWARSELETLVAADPNLVDAWFSLASMRWSAKETDGALAALDEVVQRAPDHPLAWNNRVVILRESGRVDQALATVERLASQNPHDVRWPRHRVDLLARQERPKETLAAAEAGLAAAGDDPYLHYMAGLSKLQTGDARGAAESLERARDLGTEAPDVHLWIGEAWREVGDVDKAVAAYKAQANATPGDVRPTLSAGLLLAQNQRCQDALPLLFTAMQRGARSPAVQKVYRDCGGL
jgi:predicted Zn-dependent protease